MYRLRKHLLAESHYLDEVIKKISAYDLENPKGKLWISKTQEYFRYYWHIDNKKEYLCKNKSKLIKALADNEYRKTVLAVAQKRKQQVDEILLDYQDDELTAIYTNLHPARKNVVTPIIQPWDMIVEKWRKQEFQENSYHKENMVYETEGGELVRSKSEKILADFFHKKGLNYLYEKPIVLKNGCVVYPDFTFLSPVTYKEIYWEHFGMMDNESYAPNAVKKINDYVRSGILPGENLICTFESDKNVLDLKIAEIYINQYLL